MRKPTYEELENLVKKYESELLKVKKELVFKKKENNKLDNESDVAHLANVEDGKQVSKRFFQVEKELKKVQQITNVGTWYLDAATNEVEWTDELFKMYGFDPKLPPPPFSEHQKLFTSKSWDILSTSLVNTVQTGIPYELELETVKKDGSNGWIWVRGETIKDDNGITIALWGAAQDITQRKKLEEELKKSNEMFKSVFNNLQDAFFQTDELGKYTLVSPSAPPMYGYASIEEMIGLPAVNLYANVIEREILLNELKAKGAIKDFIIQAKRKDDSVFWVSMNVQLIYQNGKISGTEGVVRDITERKKAEEELKRSENLLNKIFDVLPIGLWFADKNGKLIRGNPAGVKIWGAEPTVSMEEYGVFKARRLPDGKEIAPDDWALSHTISKGVTIEEELLEIVAFDGKKRIILNYTAPILDDNGDVQGAIVVNHNITKQKQAEAVFKDIIDKNPMSIQVLDMDGYPIQVNKAHYELFGVDVPADYSVMKDPQLLSLGFGELFDRIKKGEVVSFPDSYYNVHDVNPLFPNFPVWVRALGFTLNDNDGNPEKIVLMHENITERKNAETLLNDIIENNPMSIQVVDKEGYTLRGNPSFLKLFGTLPPPNFSIFEDLKSKSAELESIILRVKDGEFVHLPDVYFNAHDTVAEAPDNPLWIRALIFPLNSSVGKPEQFVFMHENITESKIAQQELIKAKEKAEESENFFRNIFENSPIGKSITSLDGKLKTNKAFANLLGYSFDEFQDKNLKEVTHPDDVQKSNEAINDLLNSGNEIIQFEKRFIHKNGSIIYATIITTLQKNSEGLPLFFLTSILNITDRIKFEKELIKAKEKAEESEKQFRLLYENSPLGTYIAMPDGVIISVNNTALKILGSPSEEATKQINILHFPPLIENGYAEKFMECVQTGNTIALSLLYQSKWGKLIHLSSYIVPLKNSNGQVEKVYTIMQDITERKQAEKELIESEDRFKKLSSFTFEGIIIHLNAITIDVNQSAVEMLGYERDEIVGKNLFTIIHSNSHALVKENLVKEVVTPYQIKAIRKDGSLFDAEIEARNILYNGECFRVACVRDITERRKAELELIAAKEKAEESDRLKSAFLANMSHEIRTPMNGILGFSELLKEPNLSGDEQQEYIGIIQKSGERMLNIINDIVSISKIESGTMDVFISEININEQVEYVYNLLKLDAAKKNLKLSINKPLTDKESVVKTDNEKFIGILTNLVKNAIKYTDSGYIEFGYLLKTTNNNIELEFYTKDTGIGIPEKSREAIFDRFVQADIADKMARQGAGLGLAISRAYIAMIGGKIWVESKEGKGSTFYFTIPYNSAVKHENIFEDHIQEDVESQVEKLNLLIAEDDEISRKLILMSIKGFCKEVFLAKNGHDVVAICRANPDIDLILMDIQMPDLNGYEATLQIREFNKSVVIIAQTAYGLSGDREKAIEAGCNDYLAKPIKKDELQLLILKYFGR